MVDVAVLIPTYNRVRILNDAIYALRTNTKSAKLHFVIGNDYEEPITLDWLKEVTVLNDPSGSLGANLNRLIKYAIDNGFEYLMQMDDDHMIRSGRGGLDLEPHIKALGDGIGWIRLMGCGFHDLTADLDGHYWRVRWDSPELYITSNRPHIKLASWHLHFGRYPEGQPLGKTEEGFCHQCKAMAADDSPQVAIPLTYDEGLWDHVGHSWQLEGH